MALMGPFSSIQRLVLLGSLGCGTAFPQFQHLATTDDGSELYFSSAFVQPGTDQVPHPKIFRWRNGAFELVAQGSTEPNFFHKYEELITPDVSGDGRVSSFVSFSDCPGMFICFSTEEFHSQVTGIPVRLQGRVQLSRNGRYAVTYGSTRQVDPTGFPRRSIRIDLETSESVVTPASSYPILSNRQAMSSEGVILLYREGGLLLWSPSQQTEIPLGFPAASALLSDDGSQIVHELFTPEGRGLWTRASDGSGLRRLADPQSTNSFSPSITNDGRTVVFVEDGQIMLADLVGGDRRQVAYVEEGVMEAVVSGLGNVIYAVTSLNRLLRVDVASGAVESLTPRVPRISGLDGGRAPGALNWIFGSGLTGGGASAGLPLSHLTEEVEVRVGDAVAWVLAADPTQILYQIPSSMLPGSTTIRVTSPTAQFESAVGTTIVEQDVDFIHGRRAGLPELDQVVIVNLDFTSLITPENRARPDDIVHLYATGLGQTVAPVPDGQPAAASPLPFATNMVTCNAVQDDGMRIPLETFYAGRAPGMIGVDQITFRLPARLWPPSPADPTLVWTRVQCGDGFFAQVRIPTEASP